MKAHLTERSVKGLQPKQTNIIVYDGEVVGFGVRITSGGKSGRKTCTVILTYRIEARERRLTIGRSWKGELGRIGLSPPPAKKQSASSAKSITAAIR